MLLPIEQFRNRAIVEIATVKTETVIHYNLYWVSSLGHRLMSGAPIAGRSLIISVDSPEMPVVEWMGTLGELSYGNNIWPAGQTDVHSVIATLHQYGVSSFSRMPIVRQRELPSPFGMRQESYRQPVARSVIKAVNAMMTEWVNGGEECQAAIELAPRIAGTMRYIPQGIVDRFEQAGVVQATVCDHWTTADDTMPDNYGDTVCSNCVNHEQYVITADDNRWNDRDSAYWSDRQECWLTYEDDDEDEDENECRDILAYSANSMAYLRMPNVIISTTSPIYMGMEFECTPRTHDDKHRLASHVRYDIGWEKVICKEDGSLASTGIELVFAPMLRKDILETWCDVDFPRGTKAWDMPASESCGMHVHIDTRSFTKASLAKLLAFWYCEDNARMLHGIAGRHPSIGRCYADKLEHTSSSAAMGYLRNDELSSNRYVIVNLQRISAEEANRLGLCNASRYGGSNGKHCTVELRLCKASMKPERLKLQLELCEASVHFARDASMQDAATASFKHWILKSPKAKPFGALRHFLITGKLKPMSRNIVTQGDE